MSNMEAFKPNWASPPGETIRDLLFEKSITLSDFAESIEVGVGFVNSLLSGNEEVTNEIADKLEGVLGADRGFWLAREEQYREDVKRVYRNLTKDEEAWVSTVPVRSMQKLGWIPDESYTAKRYRIEFPDGSVKEIKSLNKFCKENNLSRRCLYRVMSGFKKDHKGYKIRKLED